MNISEISERLGVSSYTLRYYEKMGLIKNITRNQSGNRVYSNKDCDWIQFLLRLKKIKMPISDIIRYADLRYKGDETAEERCQLLIVQKDKLRKQIEQLSESIKIIEEKIEIYKGMKSAEKGCRV